MTIGYREESNPSHQWKDSGIEQALLLGIRTDHEGDRAQPYRYHKSWIPHKFINIELCT